MHIIRPERSRRGDDRVGSSEEASPSPSDSSDGLPPGRTVYMGGGLKRRKRPANKTNSSNLNDKNSHLGRPCQHAGCSSLILTGGNYCIRHKTAESPANPATNGTASPREIHETGSKVQSQPPPLPRVNGHPVETFSNGDTTITVNTSRQPVQPPVSNKKQLPGKSIARKTAGGIRSTPTTSSPFPDYRLGKRSRLSSINNDDSYEKDLAPTEFRKTNGTAGEDISLRLKHTTNEKAPQSRQPNGGNRERNSPKPNSEEKRPPDRQSGPVSAVIRDDGRHKPSNIGQDATKVYNPHAIKSNGVGDSRGRKDLPTHPNPRKDHGEVQRVCDRPIARNSKEHSIPKDKQNTHGNAHVSNEVPTLPSWGQKSSGSDRHSEPLQSKKPHIKEVNGTPNQIGHNTTRSEPTSSAAILTNVPNGVNGVHTQHTQARFAILTPPSQNGRRRVIPETSPASPVANAGTDSDDTPLTKGMSKARFWKGLPTSFKGKAATSHPTIEPSSRAASVTINEAQKVNGVGSHPKDLSNQSKSHPQKKMSLSVAERQKQRIENHDPEKFDTYIYGKANEPFRPGSALFDVPWYAQPPRPVRPATHFGYFDPRVHWSQPKPEQWYREKREEIRRRGGRKAQVGKAAATLAHRRLEDQKVDRRINLPDRVANNPQWMKALDELDEMAEANRRRMLKAEADAKTKTKAKAKTTAEASAEASVGRERGSICLQPGVYIGARQWMEAKKFMPNLRTPPQPGAQSNGRGELTDDEDDEEEDEDEHEIQHSDNDEVEYENPSRARRQRKRRGGGAGGGGRKKGKARATTSTAGTGTGTGAGTAMVVGDDEEDYYGGDDDECMGGVVSDLQ